MSKVKNKDQVTFEKNMTDTVVSPEETKEINQGGGVEAQAIDENTPKTVETEAGQVQMARRQTKESSIVGKKLLFKLVDFTKHFPLKKAGLFNKEEISVKANEGVNLEIYQGETLGLVGESGCGKSTLGRTLLRLYPITRGEIIYYGDPDYPDGIDLGKLSEAQMRKYRKDLQIIFQDPYSSLSPRMTVGQIISEGLIANGLKRETPEKTQEFILETMEKCGLQPYFVHRYPHQFSGGQRQRIGIARAVALEPKFIVADEPVSALDVSIQSQVINLLLDLKREKNLTYLFISHDLSVIKYISDRVGVMYLGNIVELADTEDIYESRIHPYTEALMSAIPTTDLKKEVKIKMLEGDIPSPINPPSGCKYHTRCPYAQEKCKTDVPEFREVRPHHWVACHYPLLDEQAKEIDIDVSLVDADGDGVPDQKEEHAI